MRLIDVDKLIEWLDIGRLRNPMELCFSEHDIAEIIRNAPTVDAEPVRHGKWVCIFELDDNVQCNCSVCGAEDLHARDTVAPFCWNCGAKMDGE